MVLLLDVRVSNLLGPETGVSFWVVPQLKQLENHHERIRQTANQVIGLITALAMLLASAVG